MAIAPTTDGRAVLTVHRCRFVDWTPSPITAIAFSPLAPPNPAKLSIKVKPLSKFGTLAVGHANGTIELCEWPGVESSKFSPQAWTVRRVFAAPTPSKVESIAFSIRDPYAYPTGAVPALTDLRLFTTSGGNDLLEWDIPSGMVKSITDSEASSIWSISVNPVSTALAIGCDDGSIRIFSLVGDELRPIRRLDRAKSRLLSLAWGVPAYVPPKAREGSDPQDSDDDDEADTDPWRDIALFAGCADSSIRKWDVMTGRIVERMTTDKVRGEQTLIWTIGVMPDGTIVSGDSLGSVKFWDPLTCTQLHSYQGHGADVLCLAIGPDGKSVYTSGVDQRISEFSMVQVAASSESESPAGRWIHTRSRRVHTHDVRCISIWPPVQVFPKIKGIPSKPVRSSDADAPVIASGGLDMCVVLTPCVPPAALGATYYNPIGAGPANSFEDAYYRRISYGQLTAGGSRIVQLAHQARYLLCRRETGITIWYVHAQAAKSDLSPETSSSGGWDKLLDMELKVESTLVSSAISDDGTWLAVSDAYETKLFHLINESETMGGPIRLRPVRVKTFSDILRSRIPSSTSLPPSTAASALQFTPDSTKLILAIASLVVIMDLHGANSGSKDAMRSARVIRHFSHHRLRSGGALSGGGGRVIKPLPGTANTASPESDPADEDDQSREVDREVSEANEEAIDGSGGATWPVISHVAVSPDGQWLATSDLHGRTHVFNLDAVQHHCTLPTSPLAPTVLAFDPASPHYLHLGFPDNTLQIFDVESRQYPGWSRPLCAALQQPTGITHLREPLAGIAFVTGDAHSSPVDTGAERFLVLWSANWLCKFELGTDGGSHNSAPQYHPGHKKQYRKRKHHGGPGDGAGKDADKPFSFKVVMKYHDMLLVDFLNTGEMVVVERPLIDVLHTLPPAYFKARYGSG